MKKLSDYRIAKWYNRVGENIMEGDRTFGVVAFLSLLSLVVTFIVLIAVIAKGMLLWKLVAVVGLIYTIASIFAFIISDYNYRRKPNPKLEAFLCIVPIFLFGLFTMLVAIFTLQLNPKPSE